jgi:hypothetical protein
MSHNRDNDDAEVYVFVLTDTKLKICRGVRVYWKLSDAVARLKREYVGNMNSLEVDYPTYKSFIGCEITDTFNQMYQIFKEPVYNKC